MSRAAFLFPGQGSQMVGMGKSFYESFSQAVDLFVRADEALGFGISKLCFEGPEEELKLTQNTQPALLLVSFAAYTLLGKRALYGSRPQSGRILGFGGCGLPGF